MREIEITREQLLSQLAEARKRIAALESREAQSCSNSTATLSFPFPTVLDHLTTPVFVKDTSGKYLDCNKAFGDFLNLSREEIVGKTAMDVAPPIMGKKFDEMDELLYRTGGIQSYDYELQAATGEIRNVWIRKSIFTDASGMPGGIIGEFVDVTERKQAEDALRETKNFVRSTLDGLSAHIALLDAEGTILLVNKAWREFARLNGIPPENVSEGANYLAACDNAAGDDGVEAMSFAEGIRLVLAGEKDFFILEYPCHSKHQQRWFAGRVTPFAGEGPRRVVVAHEDISERKQTEMALEHTNRQLEILSVTDGLTGLANRRYFDEALTREHSRHARSGFDLSLILLDIDHFKAFNDSYGHTKGDECLRQIAHVVARCAGRAADVAARYGGEEFVCILPETDPYGALGVAEKIRREVLALAIPHAGSPTARFVTVSLGVVTAQCVGGESVQGIIDAADMLLYRAKSKGRNCIQFDIAHLEGVAISKNDTGEFIQLIWNDSFCCGNELLDSQHQSLFQTSNMFLEAMLATRPPEDIAAIMSKLLGEVVQHFEDEENILREVGFPNVEHHRKEHAKLIAKGLRLSQGFKDSIMSVADVFQFLVYDVVMLHMLGADKEYYSYFGSDTHDEPSLVSLL